MSVAAALEADSVLLPLNDLEPRAPDVETLEGNTVLRVSCCARCGRAYLPSRPRCLDCGSQEFKAATLPAQGTLYSFSTVHVASGRAVPYTIGYVDLTPGLRILAEIDSGSQALRCDIPVELAPGAQTLRFQPVETAA